MEEEEGVGVCRWRRCVCGGGVCVEEVCVCGGWWSKQRCPSHPPSMTSLQKTETSNNGGQSNSTICISNAG